MLICCLAKVKFMNAVSDKDILQNRYDFFSLKQRPGQVLLDYIAKLEVCATLCNFRNSETKAVLEQFVLGIANITLQSYLQIETNLILNKSSEFDFRLGTILTIWQ